MQRFVSRCNSGRGLSQPSRGHSSHISPLSLHSPLNQSTSPSGHKRRRQNQLSTTTVAASAPTPQTTPATMRAGKRTCPAASHARPMGPMSTSMSQRSHTTAQTRQASDAHTLREMPPPPVLQPRMRTHSAHACRSSKSAKVLGRVRDA